MGDLVRANGLYDSKPMSSSMAFDGVLSKYEGTPLSDHIVYGKAVGALQYCTLTRTDIPFNVNKLSVYVFIY